MTKLWISLAGLVVVLAPGARAAGFDCARAQRPVEKLICRDPKLKAADERLGQVYRAGLGKLPPAGVGPLRADQVQWLAWMQEICHAAGADAPATPVAHVAACMLPVYEQRTKQLRGIAVQRDGVSFLMRTQYLASPEEPETFAPPPHPGFGTLQVSWPLALENSPEWIAWNRAAEIAAYSVAADAQDSGKGARGGEPRWTPDLAKGVDTEIAVHVRKVEHGRITSAVTLEAWRGAHPSELYSTHTWLLQAKRPLRADDVFQPGDAWKKTVSEACWTAIHKGDKSSYVYGEVTGPDATGLQTVISDLGNWTLEHDGLHISYPEYSVSPRYARMDDTVIPWTALQPVLAAGFTAP